MSVYKNPKLSSVCRIKKQIHQDTGPETSTTSLPLYYMDKASIEDSQILREEREPLPFRGKNVYVYDLSSV